MPTTRTTIPTFDDFRYPISEDQVLPFAPNLLKEWTHFCSAVNQEADNIRASDQQTCGYDPDRAAAVLVIIWYLQAPESYELIQRNGVAAFVNSRRSSFAWAVLVRAKHDGMTFPL
jgi:hypothetical protein